MLAPLARMLVKAGISPNAVTVAGTVGVSVLALVFFPQGHLLIGAAGCALFLLGDGLDGNMARLGGKESRFGAFLDSTCDRVADAAVFAGLAGWGLTRSHAVVWLAMATMCVGFLVSYTRARAEAEGWSASVGLFERTDRLVLTLLSVTIAALGGGAVALGVGLAVVLVGSGFTVGQRIATAYRQSLLPPGPSQQ